MKKLPENENGIDNNYHNTNKQELLSVTAQYYFWIRDPEET